MSQTNIVLLNAFNPLGTAHNPRGVESLFDLWKDHAPPNEDKGGQDVVFVGRKDKSLLTYDSVENAISLARDESQSMQTRRAAASVLLFSFCPFKTAECLVKYRNLSPDFSGHIVFDDEVPAWLSPAHYQVYLQLRDAVSSLFPNAGVYEYGGMPTDFVRMHDPKRLYEIMVMQTIGSRGPLSAMTHLYVPSEPYIKDIKRWGQMCRENVAMWKASGKKTAVAVNPILQTGPNWSDGRPVPPEIMAETIESIADAGFPVAIWQAGNTPEQFDTVCKAIDASVGRAVAMVEGRKA